MPVRIDDPTILLDFHVFDLLVDSSHPVIIGRPVMKILEKVLGKEVLKLEVGKEYLPMSFS